MSDDEPTAAEALATAQRALAKNIEMRNRLDGLAERQDALDARMADIEARMDAIEAHHDELELDVRQRKIDILASMDMGAPSERVEELLEADLGDTEAVVEIAGRDWPEAHYNE